MRSKGNSREQTSVLLNALRTMQKAEPRMLAELKESIADYVGERLKNGWREIFSAAESAAYGTICDLCNPVPAIDMLDSSQEGAVFLSHSTGSAKKSKSFTNVDYTAETFRGKNEV